MYMCKALESHSSLTQLCKGLWLALQLVVADPLALIPCARPDPGIMANFLSLALPQCAFHVPGSILLCFYTPLALDKSSNKMQNFWAEISTS